MTYYVYDGEKPILEYKSGGVQSAKNLYGKGIDEILQRIDYSVTPNYVLYYQDDHEGSVTHLTAANGTVVESYRYDAFGSPAIFNGSGTQINSSGYNNRFMFTGREYASTFGIYEYRARAYHPGLGRFISEDPKGFVHRATLGAEPGKWEFFKQPDSGELNLFRYCENDPVDYTDAMGLEPASAEEVDYVMGEGYSAAQQQKLQSTLSGMESGLRSLPLGDIVGAMKDDDTAGALRGIGMAAIPTAQAETKMTQVAARSSGPIIKTSKEMAKLAEGLGLKVVKGMKSMGEKVYSDGKRFFTRDITSHTGGAMKELNDKGKRVFTVDRELNRIGP